MGVYDKEPLSSNGHSDKNISLKGVVIHLI